MSVRDLYRAAKREIIANQGSFEMRNLNMEKLFDLMKQIDYLFEMCTTENEITEKLFESPFPQVDLSTLNENNWNSSSTCSCINHY